MFVGHKRNVLSFRLRKANTSFLSRIAATWQLVEKNTPSTQRQVYVLTNARCADVDSYPDLRSLRGIPQSMVDVWREKQIDVTVLWVDVGFQRFLAMRLLTDRRRSGFVSSCSATGKAATVQGCTKHRNCCSEHDLRFSTICSMLHWRRGGHRQLVFIHQQHLEQ